MTGRALPTTGDSFKVLFKTEDGKTFIVKLSNTMLAVWNLTDDGDKLKAAEDIALHLPSSKMLPNDESAEGDPIYSITSDNGYGYNTLAATLENL
jgi:hypothetical protein